MAEKKDTNMVAEMVDLMVVERAVTTAVDLAESKAD